MRTIKLTIEVKRNEDFSYSAVFSERKKREVGHTSSLTDPVLLAQAIGDYATHYVIRHVTDIAGTAITRYDELT